VYEVSHTLLLLKRDLLFVEKRKPGNIGPHIHVQCERSMTLPRWPVAASADNGHGVCRARKVHCTAALRCRRLLIKSSCQPVDRSSQP